MFKAVGYICQRCGKYSKGNLDYHHIQPIGCGGNHHPHNLAPVCRECHKFIHSGKYKGPLLKLRRIR